MGWLITLGILLLLGLLPLGIGAVYDEDGPLVRIIAGPFRFKVFPTAKNKKKKDKKKDKQAKEKDKGKSHKTSGKKSQTKPKKKGGPITDFLPLVKVVLDFLNGFRKKLRVKKLELKVIMAADDPCDLAVNYGKAWTAVGNLMPALERVFVIGKRDIEVECAFTADKTRVFADLDITITLGRLLSLVGPLVYHAVIELFKIIKKRKGGAVNEPKSS